MQLPKNSTLGPMVHALIKKYDGNVIVWPARDEQMNPLVMLGAHPDHPDGAISLKPDEARGVAKMLNSCADFVDSNGVES